MVYRTFFLEEFLHPWTRKAQLMSLFCRMADLLLNFLFSCFNVNNVLCSLHAHSLYTHHDSLQCTVLDSDGIVGFISAVWDITCHAIGSMWCPAVITCWRDESSSKMASLYALQFIVDDCVLHDCFTNFLGIKDILLWRRRSKSAWSKEGFAAASECL